MNKYMFISEADKDTCVEFSKLLRRLKIIDYSFIWKASVDASTAAKKHSHYRGNWIVSWPK